MIELHEAFEHYKQLQEQFKSVHKEVDQIRNNKSRPGELRKEINQMEEESHQLSEKIAHLKKKNHYEVTSFFKKSTYLVQSYYYVFI
jgi:intraflagellar transport protein 81